MKDMRGTIKVNPPDLNVYGTVKVGDRGQVVIPSDARKEFDIKAGDHLLVISTPRGDGVALIKAEAVREIISKMSMGLSISDDDGTRSSAKKSKK
jgi:AbrB family looped-hinge helix DNA binding protein